ncbi:MAG: carbonic anhydrase [Sphingomonadales bacterium]
MSDLDTLYQRNQGFARTFDQGDLPIKPRHPTIVLTCLDARVDPAHFLGLELGETLVLRNAGGRVTEDVEQNLALLSGMMGMMAGGKTPPLSLAIVHHTDCGVERIAAPEQRQALGKISGLKPEVLERMAISDHDASFKDDIERLRASELVPSDLEVSTHLYDVTSGKMTQVAAPAPLNKD